MTHYALSQRCDDEQDYGRREADDREHSRQEPDEAVIDGERDSAPYEDLRYLEPENEADAAILRPRAERLSLALFKSGRKLTPLSPIVSLLPPSTAAGDA